MTITDNLAQCAVTWEDPTSDHTHACAGVAFPDHGGNHHLCRACGWVYPDDTYERNFITHDKTPGGADVTFKMIEDESGGIYWGYGHRDGPEFIEEINRWLLHCGAIDHLELVPVTTSIKHLWAKYENEGDEHFVLVKDHGSDALKKVAGVFPVTRLWL